MRLHHFILLLTTIFLLSCSTKSKNDSDYKCAEKYRSQVHFSADKNWMGYPTGFVYFDNEYHLFFQHNPKNKFWGNIHWGHAVSKDLIHWKQLPIALYPDSLGYILSGSVVVDIQNTSGFGTKKNPAFIAFYTYFNSSAKDNLKYSQAMAFSTDKGRSWVKYSNNPIILNPGITSFSDPKVLWYEPTKNWIMVVSLENKINFYASKNCKNWLPLSSFGMNVESENVKMDVPDFFPIKVEGSNKINWVLFVSYRGGSSAQTSSTRYFVGDFDGKSFVAESSYFKYNFLLDYGKDSYANYTINDPTANKTVAIGWMNNLEYAGQEPTNGWSGTSTFPRELSLINKDNIFTLISKPIKGINKLYGESTSFKDLKITDEIILSDEIKFPLAPVDIQLMFDNQNSTAINFSQKYGIKLKNSKGEYICIGYDNVEKFFYIDRTNASGEMTSKAFKTKHSVQYKVDNVQVHWRLIVDKNSVELFADNYYLVMTDAFYPTEDFDEIALFSDLGSINLKSATITQLNSIWKNIK